MSLIQPQQKPKNPCFSSGPCAKHPGWSLARLNTNCLGRSHRSTLGKKALAEVIERSRTLLDIPEDYKIAIVPASDTGAVEMALWSLLGQRGVDVLAWESFSQDWHNDIVNHLKINNVTAHTAPYGSLPDITKVNFDHDVVFAWNGTTSGVRVPDGSFIPDLHAGLVIVDATSAVFAYDLPWHKLDVVTWSWQKVIGSEAAHGMLVLSPRAVERLETYTPEWPLPKLFRMTSKGKLIEGLFKGETINTPSMLAIADILEALEWAEGIGGLPALQQRNQNNAAVLDAWITKTPWIDYLAKDKRIRSTTSICLEFVSNQTDEEKAALAKTLVHYLEKEQVAYDINAYRDAPPGLRIWCGATVEASDLECLTLWLETSYQYATQQLKAVS